MLHVLILIAGKVLRCSWTGSVTIATIIRAKNVMFIRVAGIVIGN
jgi:hypothetical protein